MSRALKDNPARPIPS